MDFNQIEVVVGGIAVIILLMVLLRKCIKGDSDD